MASRAFAGRGSADLKRRDQFRLWEHVPFWHKFGRWILSLKEPGAREPPQMTRGGRRVRPAERSAAIRFRQERVELRSTGRTRRPRQRGAERENTANFEVTRGSALRSVFGVIRPPHVLP